MGPDLKSATVVKQAVEDIRSFVGCSRDDLDVVGSMLVRDVGVERKPRVDAVAGVDFTGPGPAFARAKELTVGR
jgi:hypothetical protein